MGILDQPAPWNVIYAFCALVFLGTFIYKMVKGTWWWKDLKKKE